MKTFWGLYALDTGTEEGLADSPWPKFKRDLQNTGRFIIIPPDEEPNIEIPVIMSRWLQLGMPFTAIGLVFIALGKILNDTGQITFGAVWLVIAIAAVVIRSGKRSERHGN